MRSYASGVASQPLIGETIGENLERAVARFGDREALVVRHQGVRLTYAELDAQVNALARGLLGAGLVKSDRVGIWAPNCAEWVLVQFATAKAGIVLVNVNPAYRTTELEYALRQSGCRMLIAARSFKTSDYAAMIDEVRGDLPALDQVVLLDSPEWDALRGGRRARARPRRPRLRRRRSTSSTRAAPPASPRAPRSATTTSSTTATSSVRAARYDEDRPRLHPGAVLPLLRHGHGQPRLRHPRRDDGHPRGRLRARGGARGRAGGALHVALRRADDVHRRAQPPATSPSSTCRRCAPGSWPARRARSRS